MWQYGQVLSDDRKRQTWTTIKKYTNARFSMNNMDRENMWHSELASTLIVIDYDIS